jgi:hypothetical protein
MISRASFKPSSVAPGNFRAATFPIAGGFPAVGPSDAAFAFGQLAGSSSSRHFPEAAIAQSCLEQV